jgi:hypothetical protein
VSALGRVGDLETRLAARSGGVRSSERFPQLTLVRRPVRRAARTPFAVLLVIIAGVGLVGLLLINTGLQKGAVEVSQLDRDNQILRERVQALTQTIDAASAPQRLAARAQELGMVPNPRPAFLRLFDGTVVGDPKAAEAPPPPPAPPASEAAAPADEPPPAPANREAPQ